NRVYYGHGAYGLGAATKTYFGSDKQTKDLTPAQAAFLAGLIQAPSGNDPQTHYDRAHNRELEVLQSMVSAQMLSQSEATLARSEDIQKELKFDTSFRATRAPHLV